MGKKTYVWATVSSVPQWVEVTSGAGVTTSASAPSATYAGQIYFNTATQKLYVYNGTNWVDTSVDDEHLAYVYFD